MEKPEKVTEFQNETYHVGDGLAMSDGNHVIDEIAWRQFEDGTGEICMLMTDGTSWVVPVLIDTDKIKDA